MRRELMAHDFDKEAIRFWESEGGRLAAVYPYALGAAPNEFGRTIRPPTFAKIRNDDGISEILIGMKEFECIGVSPPHDHPHIYLNMGLSNAMLCPYCATGFHFSAELAPDGIHPANCRYNQ